MQAFRMMGELYATPAMQAVSSDPFPASYSERVRKVGVVNTRNRLMTAGIGMLLDGPAALQKLPHPQHHHRGLHVCDN